MNKDDVKAAIRNVIDSMIKDDADSAQQSFHDALSSKMRERINPASDPDLSDPDQTGSEE